MDIYTPLGVKLSSKQKLKKFIETNNLRHDPNNFNFDPYTYMKEESPQATQNNAELPSCKVGQDVSKLIISIDVF